MIWPDFPLAFYPVAIVAILLTGMVKGGFGTGAGGLAVPLMSIYIAPPEAAGIMLPILCAMDHLQRPCLPRPLVARASARAAARRAGRNRRRRAGVRRAAGQRDPAPDRADRRDVRAEQLVRADRAHSPSAWRKPGRAAGAFWGAASGFTSTLAHAGGPPFAVYMLPQRIDKTALVATSAVFFLVVNYVKLVPYAFLGQLNAANLTTALIFAPLAPLGIWLGVWLHKRASEAAFYHVSYTLLFVTGLKLVWDAFAH